MNDSARILVVDDDPDVQTACRLLLKQEFAEVSTLDDPGPLEERARQNLDDIILLDMNFGPGESSGAQGLYWLSRVLEINAGIAVIMITAHGGIPTAVEAMKRGATDYVLKPWNNDTLLAIVRTAVKRRASRVEPAALEGPGREPAGGFSGPVQPIIGTSNAIRKVLSIVHRAAPTDANVLIIGEHGTGKELIAREIHRLSRRSGDRFIRTDMRMVAGANFESELFGYGAEKSRGAGTVFLDEIGSVPRDLQTGLLTACGDINQNPDLRLIAATSLPPAKLRDESIIRQDLLFRLNTVEIFLPALRDRRDDIPLLVQHYLKQYEKKYRVQSKEIAPEALNLLTNYGWPGNIRELCNFLERAVILSGTSKTYKEEDFPLPPASASVSVAERSDTTLDLARLERQAVEAALKKHHFNISAAAKELGVTRATLYRRMDKHGL